MNITLAFDVYGTLVDTSGVVDLLTEMVGDKARLFSETWRNKQLEYSFRRGLMGDYVTFSTCTRQALEYTCQHLGSKLSTSQIEVLLVKYNSLPAFDDAKQALPSLQDSGHQLYAFSNGDPHSVGTVLNSAGIRDYFAGIISVDDIATFKPNPAVYQHFVNKTGADINSTWLISSNPFDVIGALNSGLKAIWIKRSDLMVFDPWDYEPTAEVHSLEEISDII